MRKGGKLVRTAEGVAWSMVGLTVLLVLVFAALHLGRSAPVVGGVFSWTASHASNQAYAA